jgi:hypothetical protein
LLWTNFKRPLTTAAAILIAALALADEIRVEVGMAKTPTAIHDLTDAAVRRHAAQTALLGRSSFERWTRWGRLKVPYTLPLRVVLTRNGVPLPPRQMQGVGSDINPVFDSVGPRVFPAGYQSLLQSVFTQARPTMNVVFGAPALGGDVHVRNYDADIQDRYAVAGGYYIPNGADGPEIRFPVYNSAVSAAVNYVHCLLLAYQGVNTYPFDAVEEGVVRAATMRVVRTPGALPGPPDPNEVEATLDSLYDVSAFYDWYNHPALGCTSFIAPNLLNTTLPPGGSTGGIYLIRYLMAGTAWSKVTTEYPAFLPQFNAAFYANPGLYTSMDDFAALGQTVIDGLSGPASTIEGFSFEDWVERQYIFDTTITAGMKIMVQPFPIAATGGTSDFGVFAIEANAFRTAANGDESLLAGTSYPIYWGPDFVRFFASVQDDQIRFAGAYGSVVPNFVGTTFNGQQYRVAVDVPFLGANTRVVLPAGSFSTGTNPLTNNFIGTLTGLAPGTYTVSVEWIGGSQTNIPVQNFAFGARITDSSYNNAQPVTVRVFLNAAEIFSRRVNKGVGMLALNVSGPASDTTYAATLDAEMQMVGFPLQPYRQRPTAVLGTTDNETMFARWNPTSLKYDLFPDVGQAASGLGFFLRPPSLTNVSIDGYSPPRTPATVALMPGWNQVTVPFNEDVDPADTTYTVATEAISTFAEAQGTIIGNTIFHYVPDGVNPDLGTMLPATTLEAGKAYFVRALRPEGGAMVFTPSVIPFNGPTQQVASVPEGQKWETKVEFVDRRARKTHVIVGQNSVTPGGYDPRFDSELPPTTGGFQSAIMTNRTMYKDVGVWNQDETFRIVVTGLVRGDRYTMKLQRLAGNKTLYLYDPVHNRYSRLRTEEPFTATSATQTFLIVARRGS